MAVQSALGAPAHPSARDHCTICMKQPKMSSWFPTPVTEPSLVPHPSPGKMAGQLHHLTFTVCFSNDIFPVGKTQHATLVQDDRTKEQLSGKHHIAPIQTATLYTPQRGWWLFFHTVPQLWHARCLLACQELQDAGGERGAD